MYFIICIYLVIITFIWNRFSRIIKFYRKLIVKHSCLLICNDCAEISRGKWKIESRKSPCNINHVIIENCITFSIYQLADYKFMLIIINPTYEYNYIIVLYYVIRDTCYRYIFLHFIFMYYLDFSFLRLVWFLTMISIQLP